MKYPNNIAVATEICLMQGFPMMVFGHKVAEKTYPLGATGYTFGAKGYTFGATGYTFGATGYTFGANVYPVAPNVYPVGAKGYALGAKGYSLMTIVNEKMVVGLEESRENIVSQIK